MMYSIVTDEGLATVEAMTRDAALAELEAKGRRVSSVSELHNRSTPLGKCVTCKRTVWADQSAEVKKDLKTMRHINCKEG
jgi:hypothetical protein